MTGFKDFDRKRRRRKESLGVVPLLFGIAIGAWGMFFWIWLLGG